MALGGLLLVAAAAVLVPRALHKMPDFEVYWHAGRRFIAAEPLYRAEDGHYQNKYLPIFAALVAPLALLPLMQAKAIWLCLSIAVVVGLVALSLRLLPHRDLSAGVIVSCTVLAMLKFYAHELSLGQCNALMALCIVVAFGCLFSGRPVLAAWPLALAVVIKPYAVIVLPYLLIKNRFETSAVFLALIAAALVLPAVIYGGSGNRELLENWLQTVSQSTPGNLLNPDAVSIWAMYAKWFGPGSLAFGLAVATIVAIAGGLVAVVRAGSGVPHAEYLEMAVLLTLIPLCSPQGWDYGLLMATPAVMLLVSEFRRYPPQMRVVVVATLMIIGLSVFDLMGRRAYAAFMSVSAITVCALVLLGSLAALRVRRLA
jgi:hypothetical protein